MECNYDIQLSNAALLSVCEGLCELSRLCLYRDEFISANVNLVVRGTADSFSHRLDSRPVSNSTSAALSADDAEFSSMGEPRVQ